MKKTNKPKDTSSNPIYIKTSWNIRECFKQLRLDEQHHLGLGDIRLTIAQQEEICELVEHFYRDR